MRGHVRVLAEAFRIIHRIRLMIAFEVKVNGESLTIAGADDLAVLTAIVTAVGKLGCNSAGAAQLEQDYKLELTVGGLTSRIGGAPDEHFDWSKRTLQPGDIVTVKLVEANATDSPIRSQPARAYGD